MPTEPTRLQPLNNRPPRDGRYVLYWMQAAQRAEHNPALEYAVSRANALDQPLVAVFGLTPHFPEANERHYRFMLEGLTETRQALEKRGIALLIFRQEPPDAALQLAQDASLLITDRGYLRIQKQWRQSVALKARCPVVQVETEVVVPVDEVSDKEEAGAYTLRPKLTKLLDKHLQPLKKQRLQHPSLSLKVPGSNLTGELRLPDAPPLRHYGSASRFTGGTQVALKLLRRFIRDGLPLYHEQQNQPDLDATSHLSPYLHFGQISPVQVALMAREAGGDGADRFLEQLIVRRELAMDFVAHNEHYNSYKCITGWQAQTLGEHASDPRPVIYSLDQLEAAETADEYWNAAMREMLLTGFMHGYMRMYWGKKIIEWSPDPAEAFQRILHLNNRYFVDGRDPVSFANVAWCFGKHDRPFAERAVFGKIRYMNAAGLKRKFSMQGYLERVARLDDGSS